MEKKLKISRTDAKKLAEELNSVIVWGNLANGETSKVNFDPSKAARLQQWHDEAGRKVNEMLGVDAIIPYKRC